MLFPEIFKQIMDSYEFSITYQVKGALLWLKLLCLESQFDFTLNQLHKRQYQCEDFPLKFILEDVDSLSGVSTSKTQNRLTSHPETDCSSRRKLDSSHWVTSPAWITRQYRSQSNNPYFWNKYLRVAAERIYELEQIVWNQPTEAEVFSECFEFLFHVGIV